MAYKEAVNSLVPHYLLDSDSNLLSNHCILTLVRSMHGSIAYSEGIYLCLLKEIQSLQWIGIAALFAEYIILYPCKYTKLAFNRYSSFVGILYHLSGKLHIFLVRKAAAIYHNTGVSPVYGSLAGIKVIAVVKVEYNRNLAVFSVFSNRISYVLSTFFLVFERAFWKINAAAHKAIGEIGSLNNGRASKLFVYLDKSLYLCYGIGIKCTLSV